MILILLRIIVMRLSPVAVALAASLLAGGCGGATATSSNDELEAVAAFYPLRFVLERVAGDDVRVEEVTKAGAEPHDAELTPRQAARLSEADLVVFLRGFQPAVDGAVDLAGADRALDVSTAVPAGEAMPADEHADEHGEGDEHDHGAGDPHVWLDPTKLAAITKAVADRLGRIDQQHAAAYDERASDLVADLEQLDADFRTGLDSCERREFVTNHDAFGHLGSRYDLEQIAISGLSPEAEPSLARVQQVQELVREHGVTTIFYETLVSPKTAETIARDAGVRTAVLDPVEAITNESPGRDYLEVMHANLAALREANGCR